MSGSEIYGTSGDDGDGAALEVPGVDRVDVERIVAMCATLRQSTTEGLLHDVFDSVPGGESLISSIGKYCTFDHGAILIFPRRFSDVTDALPIACTPPASPTTTWSPPA